MCPVCQRMKCDCYYFPILKTIAQFYKGIKLQTNLLLLPQQRGERLTQKSGEELLIFALKACIAEARHAFTFARAVHLHGCSCCSEENQIFCGKGKCNHDKCQITEIFHSIEIPKLYPAIQKFFSTFKKIPPVREEVYYRNFNLWDSDLLLLAIEVSKVFFENFWGSNPRFGGSEWGNCAQETLEALKAYLSLDFNKMVIKLDCICSLQHNCGIFFNKFAPQEYLKRILDIKFTGELDLLNKIAGGENDK